MSFPRTKEELKQRLQEEMNRPPKEITTDEYQEILKKTMFICPIGFNPVGCNGHSCPTRPNNIWEDYWWKCREGQQCKIKVDYVLNGKIVILHNNNGWEIPV